MYNLYKIGFSKNVNKRIADINSQLKYKLEILYIFNKCAILEKNIHIKYNKYRINHPIYHGGYKEWFNLNKDILNNIIMDLT